MVLGGCVRAAQVSGALGVRGTSYMAITAPPLVRPGWVWGIFIFYLITFASALMTQVVMRTGFLPVRPEQQAVMQAMSAADYVVALVIGTLQMVGATLLWRLRRQALPVLMLGLTLSTANSVRVFMKPDIISIFSPLGLAGVFVIGFTVVFGLVISAAILAYTWRLYRGGVLH